MMELTVELHETVKDNDFFKKVDKLQINYEILFKYGILNEDVPKKISENNFDYLQSKIPFLDGLYRDFIELKEKRIINSGGENAKRISEMIGVGIGLYYSKLLLDVNPNKFEKIPAPISGKYMDFKVKTRQRLYEIETKGRINNSAKNQAIKDVLAKKEDSSSKAIKFGTIVILNKEDDNRDSSFTVCDDWENSEIDDRSSLKDFFEYYKLYFSFIIDSYHYNRIYKKIDNNSLSKNMIDLKKIGYLYKFNNKQYYGRFFDKRLILEKMKEVYITGESRGHLFKKLTEKFGKKKFFLGVNSSLISLINKLDITMMREFKDEYVINNTEKTSLILDEDGIIFVETNDDDDEQIKINFSEETVMNRIDLVSNYIARKKHVCGASCKSKGKEGDSCKIMTYREHCHFHR
ncbi:MAG: hypothetical protein JXM74_09400 [Fusobacteriaceae bacterium]|nr:hypothetical protein [Fusobacteriaceae bacterium]